MYPRSFLCEEAKIKQRTPLKKELCEIGEEAIWESWFTSFFKLNIEIFFTKIALIRVRTGTFTLFKANWKRKEIFIRINFRWVDFVLDSQIRFYL